MISHIRLIVLGLLLITITNIIQSAPVTSIQKAILSPKKPSDKLVDPVESSITTSIPTTTTNSPEPTDKPNIALEIHDFKKKRNIQDYHFFNGLTKDDSEEYNDIEIKHKLHPKMKETPAQVHDNADKPVDTDNSKTFSDLKMSPNELFNLARKRRHLLVNDESTQRRKRALSAYDFYNPEPLFETVIDQEEFVRPTETFVPMYENPSFSERNIRSSLYEPSDWNTVYTDTAETDGDQGLVFNDDDGNMYEYNPYPLVIDSSNIPYNSWQLQRDDLSLDDENNQDEGLFSIRYEPTDNYF